VRGVEEAELACGEFQRGQIPKGRYQKKTCEENRLTGKETTLGRDKRNAPYKENHRPSGATGDGKEDKSYSWAKQESEVEKLRREIHSPKKGAVGRLAGTRRVKRSRPRASKEADRTLTEMPKGKERKRFMENLGERVLQHSMGVS